MSMSRLRAHFSSGGQRLAGDQLPGNRQQLATSGDSSSVGTPSCSKTELSPGSALFSDGLEVLYDCRDATMNICFVHGLTGNRRSTWTASGQSAPWPQTLLPPKLSKTRVLTYGYDAYILRKFVVSMNGLVDHAKNLLNDLTTERTSSSASHRPIVFVAHSLGGLVCKEAVLLSRNNPEPHLRLIFEHTKGVLFMGTPHRGSWMAQWARIPATALGIVKSTNDTLLKVLRTDDMYLESVQDRFWSMVREQRSVGRGFEVTSFFEERPLPVAGMVVPKESATLEGYNTMSVNADHRSMVKFASENESGFKRLLGELMRWKSQIRGPGATRPTQSGEEVEMEKPACLPNDKFIYGNQYNASGGVQNINKGSGSQFCGATFSGSVRFG